MGYRRGNPYNPGQYPAADFMLGMAADPANEVPIGKAAEAIVNPELLSAGGARMFEALKNLANKNQWAKNILETLRDSHLPAEDSAEILHGLSEGSVNTPKSYPTYRGPKEEIPGFSGEGPYSGKYSGGFSKEPAGLVDVGPKNLEKLRTEMTSNTKLPNTTLSPVRGGGGAEEFDRVLNKWVPEGQLGKNENLRDVLAGKDPHASVGDYEEGVGSYGEARRAEEMFADKQDWLNSPTSKGHYAHGDVARSIGNGDLPEGNATWTEMKAIPGEQSPLAAEKTSPMQQALRDRMKLAPDPEAEATKKTLDYYLKYFQDNPEK